MQQNMNFQKRLTKKISLILIVSILSLNLSFLAVPKKTEADIPVINPVHIAEWITDSLKAVFEAAVQSAAKTAARIVIQRVTQATVDWINGGFSGQPAYVADFSKFMTGEGGVADRTFGDFIANSDLNFLCDPFRVQVMIALQLGYGANLKNQIGCTFSGVTRNINNAVNNASIGVNASANVNVSNFTSSGGWDSWLKQTLQPQNNPVGAYLIAKSNLDAQIETAKGSATLGLTIGQGALSFNRCVDTYYNKAGNQIGKSSEYTSGAGETGGGRPPAPANATRTDPKCTVKTPGSTITTMLGFKATSDQRMNELVGALSDGIDQIFSALFTSLIQKGMDQLNNGVLDTNTASNNTYNSAIGISLQNSINTYNNDASNVGSGTTIPSFNFPFSTTTFEGYYSTTTSGGIIGGSIIPGGSTGGYGGGYSELGQAQNNSISLINSLSKSELTYQNNYKIAQNVLIQAEKVFATSSICNMSYNRNDSILRSLLIRKNVITNIDGVSDSSRDIASIPWNLEVIKAALADSNANLAILNKAASDVGSASSVSAITDAMIPVNSTSFNTDPQSAMVENIKTWLRGVRGMYNSSICPIDLTKVLQINSATSTAV